MEAVWVSQGAGADQGLNLTGTLRAHVLLALPFPPELLLAVSVNKQWTIKSVLSIKSSVSMKLRGS